MAAQDETLPLTTGNEIQIKCNAPAKAGEVKVTVKVDPLPGEVNPNNNSIDTYVTVTQEGISVLLVDKMRAWEPQMICDALAEESRIRLFPVWLRGDAPSENGDSLCEFKSFMKLTDKKDDPALAWKGLHELEGTTRLGSLKLTSKVVAETEGKDSKDHGEPLLVAGSYGDGRTLAFGGDTTHRW